VEFEGNFLGFFGEASDTGLDFNATLDGKPLPYETMSWGKLVSKPVWPFNQSHGKGNLFMWRRDYPMLPSGKHVLELSPVIAAGVTNGQLRIESVCAAKFEPVAVK